MMVLSGGGRPWPRGNRRVPHALHRLVTARLTEHYVVAMNRTRNPALERAERTQSGRARDYLTTIYIALCGQSSLWPAERTGASRPAYPRRDSVRSPGSETNPIRSRKRSHRTSLRCLTGPIASDYLGREPHRPPANSRALPGRPVPPRPPQRGADRGPPAPPSTTIGGAGRLGVGRPFGLVRIGGPGRSCRKPCADFGRAEGDHPPGRRRPAASGR